MVMTENRKIKVLTIGAGVSGIMMAYKLQKYCENIEHVIYEKDVDIGGVWLQNRSVSVSRKSSSIYLLKGVLTLRIFCFQIPRRSL